MHHKSNVLPSDVPISVPYVLINNVPWWNPYTVASTAPRCGPNTVPSKYVNRLSDTGLSMYPSMPTRWRQVVSLPADSSQCQLRRTAVTSMECQMRCPLVEPKNCHVWWQGNIRVEYQVMRPCTKFMHWQVRCLSLSYKIPWNVPNQSPYLLLIMVPTWGLNTVPSTFSSSYPDTVLNPFPSSGTYITARDFVHCRISSLPTKDHFCNPNRVSSQVTTSTMYLQPSLICQANIMDKGQSDVPSQKSNALPSVVPIVFPYVIPSYVSR
jgi:hypothetical protein